MERATDFPRPPGDPEIEVVQLGPGMVFRAFAVFMFIVTFYLVASIRFWGPRYGSIVAILAIAFLAYPTMGFLLNVREPGRSWPPTPGQVNILGIGMAILIALAGLFAVWLWLQERRSFYLPDVTFVFVVVLLAAPIPLLATRQLSAVPRSPPSIPADRGSLLSVLLLLVALPLAGLSLLLLAAPAGAWQPFMFTNRRDGFDRLAGAWQTVLLPASTLGIPLVVSLFVGFAAAVLQRHGFARSREQRKRSLEMLSNEANALYARGDLEREPFLALQSSIRTEMDGLVPGEAELLQARIALGALLALAVATIITAGVTLVTGLMTPDLDICSDCQTMADQVAFRAAVSDWRLWMLASALLLGVYGLFAFLMVPHLRYRARNAQIKTRAFRAERERLIETYLQPEVVPADESFTTRAFT